MVFPNRVSQSPFHTEDKDSPWNFVLIHSKIEASVHVTASDEVKLGFGMKKI